MYDGSIAPRIPPALSCFQVQLDAERGGGLLHLLLGRLFGRLPRCGARPYRLGLRGGLVGGWVRSSLRPHSHPRWRVGEAKATPPSVPPTKTAIRSEKCNHYNPNHLYNNVINDISQRKHQRQCQHKTTQLKAPDSMERNFKE